MSIDAAKSNFFRADHYAVVGASKDRAKFGNKVSFTFYEWPAETYKVLRWYKDHGLEPIPVHPKEASVEELSTIASVFDIQDPSTTSLSVITPPTATLPILKTALLELQVAGVWLQPGAENDAVKDFIESCSQEIQEKVIFGGPCILVEGEALAKEKGKL